MNLDDAIATVAAAEYERLRRAFPLDATILDLQYYVVDTPNTVHLTAATLYDRTNKARPETFPTSDDADEARRARIMMGLQEIERSGAQK